MARLTKKMEKDFTVVHNEFIRDKSLGLTARGLLLTMLSMSDSFSFSIKGLASIVPDGETKVSSALKELERCGYLRRQRIFADNGRLKHMRKTTMYIKYQNYQVPKNQILIY